MDVGIRDESFLPKRRFESVELVESGKDELGILKW